jgi:ArsR family metal-binding transcriptional regulator
MCERIMELSDFILDSCKVTPGFEFYPKKNKKIDVKDLLKILADNGYYISKDNSPFYIHVKIKEGEMTIFSSLKIIVKDLTIEDEAKKIVSSLLLIINKTSLVK